MSVLSFSVLTYPLLKKDDGPDVPESPDFESVTVCQKSAVLQRPSKIVDPIDKDDLKKIRSFCDALYQAQYIYQDSKLLNLKHKFLFPMFIGFFDTFLFPTFNLK